MTDTQSRPLVVLQSVLLGRPRPSYVDHLVSAFPEDQVRSISFSYRTALIGTWDVLHVHWPEALLRHGRLSRRILRALGMVALLLRVGSGKGRVVRTLHNLHPHEPGGRVERMLLAALDRQVSYYVRLSDATPVRPAAPVATIPHGHYHAQLDAGTESAPRPRSMLFFGYIRAYKGVDQLLDAFRALDDDRARLDVVGAPATPALRGLVETAQAEDDRISSVLDFVPDSELAGRVAAAELVVLPYQDLHNSGVLFAALSVGRPVLVPANEVTSALQAELGDEFVLTYDAPLTAGHLEAALDTASARPEGARPDLRGRAWAEVAAAHVVVFRSVVTGVRG